MPFEIMLLIAVAMVVGGLVKGVIGIGLPIVVIAILTNFLEIYFVLALVIVPILVTNLWQALHAGNLMAPLKRLWPMIVMLVLGIWLGAKLVVSIDTDLLYGLIGLAVVIFTVTSYVRPHGGLSPAAERWGAPLAGALGGILGGLSTIWGPPMTMYLIMLRLPKDEFIRAVGLIWFSGSLPLAYSYWDIGLLTGSTALISAAATIPAMIGLWLGGILRRYIDQETFRKILLIALFLIGLNLIRRAVF